MSNFNILNLSAYISPTIQEDGRDEWVGYGDSNNYYQYLIDSYNDSTTNNAVINNIAKLIYGRGLTALDASKKPNEYAQLKTLIADADIRKVALDRKMLGQFALQVHYDSTHTKILKAYHIPVHLLRAQKCNKDGDIENYYYSDNWEDVKNYVPKLIPAFGFSKSEIEILFHKPYSVGLKYYANVDYIGGLPYAKLESEIADYLINDVVNGFSGTKVVNFTNGVPSEEKQDEISRKVLRKLTGSKGQKVIIAFSENIEQKTIVDDIPLNDAPQHYQYLSDEAMRKIMLSHNVTSPLLFGIANGSGFSSNADELRNSIILFENMVIKPIQDEIIEAFNMILNYNGIALNLEFKGLNPLDSTGDITNSNESVKLLDSINNVSPLVANKILESMTANEIRQIVGLPPEKGGSDLPNETSVQTLSKHDFTSKYGHDLDESWVLIDEFDAIDLEDETDALNDVKLSKWELVKTGISRALRESEQDKIVKDVKFMTRYRYTGLLREDTRPFCKAMLTANKVYRKEDIEAMSKDPQVNAGWGPKGADTYDLFKYKGGGNCHHVWRREVYATLNLDATSPFSKDAKQIATGIAEKRGYKVRNPYQVNVQPKNLPFNGFLPTNKRFQ